jgi:hypothetical protein
VRRLLLALAVLTLLPAPARADPNQADRRVAEMLAAAKATYGVDDPRARCRPTSAQEIVVCVDHGEDLVVPSTAESDPNSREARRALDGGVPRAPQLDHGYCAECPHFGSVPPPPYYIDLKAIPEAPPGSDADKIARGEVPAP